MDQKYNFIYEKLVHSEDDLVGLVAYGIYKKHKIEVITQIKESEGREPNPDECHSFFVSSTTESQLKKYRNDAESLLSDMVMNAAGEEIKAYEDEMLREYQTNIKKVLPSNAKSISLSVLAAFIFSIIAGLFFFLGSTSEKSTNETVNKVIDKVKTLSQENAHNDSTYHKL